MIEEIIKTHKRIQELKKNYPMFLKTPGLKIDTDGKGDMNIEIQVPDDFKIKSLLMDFRPFVHQKEDLSFNKFTNRIRKEYEDDNEITKHLDQIKHEWKEMEKGKKVCGVGLHLDNKEIAFKELMQIWLFEKYYHPTGTRNKGDVQLKDLKDRPMEKISFRYFIMACCQMLVFLLWLDDKVLQKIIEKYDKEQLND